MFGLVGYTTNVRQPTGIDEPLSMASIRNALPISDSNQRQLVNCVDAQFERYKSLLDG